MKPLDAMTVELAGTTLIEASAGTGKTYTITTLFLRLLLEQQLRPGDILVVTYTRAATAELRHRIRQRLAQYREVIDAEGESNDPTLRQLFAQRKAATAHDPALMEEDRQRVIDAVRSFDEAAIFTIHGFCQRALQDNAFESGAEFENEFISDQKPLLLELISDYWVNQLHDASKLVADIATTTSELKPSELLKLVENATGAPDMELRAGPPVSARELESLASDRRRAFDRAARLWAAERDEVSAKLTDPSWRDKRKAGAFEKSGKAAVDTYFRKRSTIPKFGSRDTHPLQNLSEAKLGTKKGCHAPESAFLKQADELYALDTALSDAARQFELHFKRNLAEYARRELRKRKDERRVLSFDDLLQLLYEGISGPTGKALAEQLATRYRAALIDEFQDTDPTQYAIFTEAFRARNVPLFLIGDPKQAIYAFRGADVFAYMRAATDAGARSYSLDTNWRSDATLIEAVNHFFESATRPFYLEDIAFDPVKARPNAEPQFDGPLKDRAAFELRALSAEDAGNADQSTRVATQDVASEIAELLASDSKIDGEPLRPHHFAVLCRSNRQCELIQDALRALNVPSVLDSNQSVFASREAEEIEHLVRALASPRNERLIRAALSTSLFGISPRALRELLESDARWETWTQRFAEWGVLFAQQGFVQAMQTLMRLVRVEEHCLAFPDGERRITNVLHLVELLHSTASREHLGPQALLRWLEQMRLDAENGSSGGTEEAQVRLESDAHAVRITTIHKSKGLEYPLVYVPFSWSESITVRDSWVKFHDPDTNAVVMDLEKDKDGEPSVIAGVEALAENLRILYVALTRAKHRCSVTWAPQSKLTTSALGYLLHQPSDARKSTSQAMDGFQAAVRAHIKAGLKSDSLAPDLHRLAASCAQMAVLEVDPTRRGKRYRPAVETRAGLSARTFTRSLDEPSRVASFTALSRTSEPFGGHKKRPTGEPSALDEGPDRDIGDVFRDLDELVEGSAHIEASVDSVVPLADVPAGADVGQCMHDILEHATFDADPAHFISLAQTHGPRHGLDDAHHESLGLGLHGATRAKFTLPGTAEESTFSLSLVTDRCHRELEFVFPVGAVRRPLHRARLAEAISESGILPSEYVHTLHALEFAPLHGFMKGFIDLIFEHEGRFFVADYKSNFLGRLPSDYSAAKVAESMFEHHYPLQAIIYSVALHRHLGRVMPGYDAERHFGGAVYFYLRGMHETHTVDQGVYHLPVPADALNHISAAFEVQA